jgi:galactitol-specific phosphotransferase system IIB component
MTEEQKSPHQTPPDPGADKRKAKPIGKIIVIVIIALLLLAVGWLAWQLWICLDHDGKVNTENQQLKAQVGQLKKQLSDTQSSASANTPAQPAACTTGIAASQSLKDNIEAAITSKNTAALQGYMASSVNVVIAASEKGGSESATAATKDVEYTYSGTAPWDFTLTAVTLNAYRAGFYKQYFPENAYVGRAANNQVVSFGFDCNGKINMIFMAADESLLK